ncbi:hypothetical protein BBJ28_00004409 [Nothophytophthora sp. Chile5]|nr:hypothetical protein BBJ28_00004409 [Nothophytophthora sp. Chile5]
MVRSPPMRYDEGVDETTYYYPPGHLGPYLSSSIEQRTAPRKPQRAICFRRAVPFVVGAFCFIAIVVVTLHANSSGSAESSSADSSGSSAVSSPTSSCPTVAAQDRTVAFWQSEVSGCDRVPDGVTHVVFGFALVSGGVVVPSFQSSDANISQCVEQLHARCILAMASVGGSTNNQNMSEVTNATLFAQSAVAFVSTFGFDGLDLDDESVGSQFSAERTIELLQATREALDAAGKSTALLTYDAYFYEGDASRCAAEATTEYSRCFPLGVLDYVDWVNIMAYNVNQDDAAAAEVYAAAESSTLAAWSTQLGGNFSQATIGICVASGCAYGPGPNATIIAEWEQLTRQQGYGGMMIYAASAEVADDFPVTRSIVSVA